MNVAKKLKRLGGRVVYKIADHLPPNINRKIAVLLYVLQNDCRSLAFAHPFFDQFKQLTPDAIRNMLEGIDETSLKEITRYVAKIRFSFQRTDYGEFPHWCYVEAGLCSTEENLEGENNLRILNEYKSKYHLGNDGEFCSLIHHHGLKYIAKEYKDYLRDSIFIDAGAYVGDSSVVLLDYAPQKIIAFEPSPANASIFRHIMEINQIASSQVSLEVQGLSSQEGVISFNDTSNCVASLNGGDGSSLAKLTTVDICSQKYPGRIGLIKADLEGMALDMVKGAVDTLTQHKPILSIGVYHNTDELFGVYNYIKSLNIGYHIYFKMYGAPWRNTDLTLMALPPM